MRIIDVPDGWGRFCLGDICEEDAPIMYGILQPGAEVKDGVPYVRPSEIENGEIKLHEIKRTTPEIAAQYKRSKLRTGDLLITIVGTLGKIAEVPATLDGANITQSSARVRVNASVACRRYVKHFLRSSSLATRQYDWHRLGTGVPRLNIHHVRDLQVPLPCPHNPGRSVEEQKRIADILDKADAIRRKRRDALLFIDEIIQAAFTQTVGPNAKGFDAWPVEEIQELAASHKGAMRTGPFGSTLKHSEFVDSGIAVLGIDNAVRNRFAWDQRRYITEGKYEDLKRYTVYPGDVLITIMATNGRSAVVPDDIPTAINTKHLACVTLNRKKAEPEFVSHAIHRHPVVLRQLGMSGRGAVMTGLNLGIIKRIKIPTPPLKVQRAFTIAVRRTRDLESKLEIASAESDDLFDSLVQRAFKGEL